MHKIRWCVGFCLALVGFAAADVARVQEVSFRKGWNVLQIQVAPLVSADELFRDWPVETVSLYDPAAFLDTRQFSAAESSEGLSRAAMRIWRRGNRGASNFFSVPADSILMFNATDAWSGLVLGTPCAPRVTWHPTSAATVKNYIGLSVYEPTTLAGYFSGAGIAASDCMMVWGEGEDARQAGIFGGQTFSDGAVLAVDAAKAGDWSGVLYVSPRGGVDFGTRFSLAQATVRNDGATARTVSARLVLSAVDDMIPPPGLLVRDGGTGLANAAWAEFSAAAADRRTKTLAAGETWELQFALDRTRLSGPSGTVYGAVLEFRDEDGGSKMRVAVPLTATGDGGAAAGDAWPKGVWIAAAELDAVTHFGTRGDSTGTAAADIRPAGGRMKVRLPVYVDGEGRMALLQRLWYGRTTNGVLRAFSGAVAASDEPLVDIRRVSSSCLPTDLPVVEMSGAFGDEASAAFTVDERSNVNPMRHARHPRHDGLTADYLADAPSGDDLGNYSGTVKPESFSITNRIVFAWDAGNGTAWNPDETLAGTLRWEFGGLRHEGTIRAEGRFAMKRISPVTVEGVGD